HRDLSARDARQRKAALGIGLCDERRPHDGDARAYERLPVGLVGDAARDGALLGSPDGADAAGEAAEHQERAQRGTNGKAHTDSSFEVAKTHTARGNRPLALAVARRAWARPPECANTHPCPPAD